MSHLKNCVDRKDTFNATPMQISLIHHQTFCHLSMIVQGALSETITMYFRSQSSNFPSLAPPSGHCQHQVVSRLGNSKISHLRSTYVLLFGLAEVVAEVKVAGRFGNGRGGVRYRHVLQIQKAELDFH